MINLILISLFHWIADFICQSRQMANNKSKSLYWLTMHVITYTTVTTILWICFNQSIETLLIVWCVTFITHWLTDFITSKITTYFYLKNNMYGFFSTVGFDQVIHGLTLLMTYNYLIKEINI